MEKYESPEQMVDPTNHHSRWKHAWRWHNRGCVWDERASEWTGADAWKNAEKKRDFVPSALMNVKHSVRHRTGIGELVELQKEITPRTLGPPNNSISMRTGSIAVQLCGDSHVA